MGFGFKVLRWSTPSFLQTTNVLWVHEGRPDRAEGTLYVQSTCMNVQGRLCTVTLVRNAEAWPCRGRSVRQRAAEALGELSTKVLDL